MSVGVVARIASAVTWWNVVVVVVGVVFEGGAGVAVPRIAGPVGAVGVVHCLLGVVSYSIFVRYIILIWYGWNLT